MCRTRSAFNNWKASRKLRLSAESMAENNFSRTTLNSASISLSDLFSMLHNLAGFQFTMRRNPL